MRPMFVLPSPGVGSKTVGFTLVELLMVVAIISILAGMLLPALGRAQASALTASCQSNLKQLGHGTGMYLGEWSDYLPYGLVPATPGSPAASDADSGNNFYAWWNIRVAPYVNMPIRASNSSGYQNRYHYTDADPGRPGVMHCPSRRGRYRNDFRAAWYAPVREYIKGAVAGGGNRYELRITLIRKPSNRLWLNDAHPANTTPACYAYQTTCTDASRAGYIFNALAGDGSNEDGTALATNVRPAAVHNQGSNPLFFDGHVESMKLVKQLLHSPSTPGTLYGSGAGMFDVYL